VLTVARRRLTGGLPSSVSGTILLTGACKPLAYGTRLGMRCLMLEMCWCHFNNLALKLQIDIF